MILALGMVAAEAQEGNDKAAQALQLSQSALGNTLPQVTLLDTAGNPVQLARYQGKPLLVTLVYTSCADVCPTLIETLYPAVEEAQSALGRDSFSVITVGFDVRHDTPERMRLMARERGVDLPNWQFLAASQENLDTLARAVGFAIYARPGGYDHMAQVSVVDGKGKIYQQVYGAVFEPPVIVEPLKDLVFGRVRPVASLQDVIDRIKLFCTVYDPNSGRYYFNYSLFGGIAIGIACLGLILVMLVREWRRSPGETGHA
jgi:protein SCO1/2